MHKCLSGTGSSIQTVSFSEAVGKCCSASSLSSSAILGRQQATVSSSGEWSSILGSSEDSLSSSYVKQWHTVLREAGDGCALGVAGQKDKFSCVETWYSHGAWHRGVGIFKLLLPLSYLISSKVSSHSKASFKVVTKWPNNISSDIYVRCCAESMQKKAV